MKLIVAQTKPMPAGQHFQPIGTATLTSDGETTIRIQTTDITSFVILDAVQLVLSRQKNRR